jgi:predicted glycoside hydrolase/deacetylase ChbG (UPF0249 family)
VTRVTLESPRIARNVRSVRVKRLAARWLGKSASNTFSQRWIWTNDSFFGMLSPMDLKRPFPWDNYLSALPESGVIEWVVHPGLPDETLRDRDDYHTARPVELAALTSPAGAAHWQHLRSCLARKSVLRKIPAPEPVI